eukprot:scaffold291897_cov17-Tisochrysis_lutea.AAC.1
MHHEHARTYTHAENSGDPDAEGGGHDEAADVPDVGLCHHAAATHVCVHLCGRHSLHGHRHSGRSHQLHSGACSGRVLMPLPAWKAKVSWVWPSHPISGVLGANLYCSASCLSGFIVILRFAGHITHLRQWSNSDLEGSQNWQINASGNKAQGKAGKGHGQKLVPGIGG